MSWGNMSEERYKKLNSIADISEVIDLIERETGCDSMYISKYINKYIESLRSERQREIFRLYYFHKMSIISIHYGTGIEYNRIEKHLKSAIDNLIKAYKIDAAILEYNKKKGE